MFTYVENSPVNAVDPSGLDAEFSLVVVEGGTYAGAGHAFLEINPIAGTGGLWRERTTYGFYPSGVDVGQMSDAKPHGDIVSAYGPGTTRSRMTIKLSTSQEKRLHKWIKASQKKKWSPWYNCADYSMEAWNGFAPWEDQVFVNRKMASFSDTNGLLKQAGTVLGNVFSRGFTIPRVLGDELKSRPPAVAPFRVNGGYYDGHHWHG